jgi:hypothetical protein
VPGGDRTPGTAPGSGDDPPAAATAHGDAVAALAAAVADALTIPAPARGAELPYLRVLAARAAIVRQAMRDIAAETAMPWYATGELPVITTRLRHRTRTVPADVYEHDPGSAPRPPLS